MNKLLFLLAFLLAISSCKKTIINDEDIIDRNPLSINEQKNLSPSEIIKSLEKGNNDFIKSKLTIRNNSDLIRKNSISEFYPQAVILSCIDSRIPVEDIFHKGLGDLYVIRIIGNTVNEDIIGNLEYAYEVAGSKVILVLGHEYCSAIKTNLQGTHSEKVHSSLKRIDPAVIKAKKIFKSNQSSINPRFIDEICKQNVLNSIKMIRQMSKNLNKLEQENKIKIIGGIYDNRSGKVNFI
jgi:carbonic anhydrase